MFMDIFRKSRRRSSTFFNNLPVKLLLLLILSLAITACGGGGGGGGNGGGDADVEPPVITLLGDNQMDISFGALYTDPGATAADNVDGDCSASIVVGGCICK